jgi:LPXTG-site transpeptidase (sortase) family protein
MDTWNTGKQELNTKRAKNVRILISGILGILGLTLLLSQIAPLTGSFLQGKFYQYKAQLLAAPIPDTYKQDISGEFAYYDPGLSYFQNLTIQAGENVQLGEFSFDPITRELKKITINKEYSQEMTFALPDIGITNIPITPNVESYEEDVYNLYLKKGLAHFKGTPLPGDGGNSFIYGHSAVPSFFNNHQNLAETIFSKLDRVEVGDEIVVKKDGKEIKYTVRKKKIIEPTDFSVLHSQGDKETVTLMTCWPLGIPSKRLIVVGERYE